MEASFARTSRDTRPRGWGGGGAPASPRGQPWPNCAPWWRLRCGRGAAGRRLSHPAVSRSQSLTGIRCGRSANVPGWRC